MLPGESLLFPVLFQLVLAVTGTLLACSLALLYVRGVRLERPAIGTFNRRDIVMLFVFIVGLPLLYLVLPLEPLIVFLGITFVSALAIGLRPLLTPTLTWLGVGLVVGLNIWMARTLLGTVTGWQLFWLENSALVIAAAVMVANLYVQGGMRLQHVAWFGLILAVYDALFTFIWPVTSILTQRFLESPLDPAIGFRLGIFNAALGLGDLLVYSMFVIAVYKAYGRVTLRLALGVTVVFGAVTPALAPLVFSALIDARTDLVVPAQVAFGPAAFVSYLWLRRRFGRERTMAEFWTSADVPRPARRAAAIPATTRRAPVAAPARRAVLDPGS
ncbi:MAG: hypothetical protein ACLGIF_02220 [Actinomycetes bacterium]